MKIQKENLVNLLTVLDKIADTFKSAITISQAINEIGCLGSGYYELEKDGWIFNYNAENGSWCNETWGTYCYFTVAKKIHHINGKPVLVFRCGAGTHHIDAIVYEDGSIDELVPDTIPSEQCWGDIDRVAYCQNLLK